MLPHLDGWITALFDPANLDHTLEALVGASEDDSTTVKELREADRTLADCQRKLAHYRAALDAGSDPATVTAWINQTTAEQAVAQAKRAQLRAARPMTVTTDQLRGIVTQAGDMVGALDNANPPTARSSTSGSASRGSTSHASGSWSSLLTSYPNGAYRTSDTNPTVTGLTPARIGSRPQR